MARRLTPNARAFSDEMRATMLDALAQGSTYRAACGAAGISWPTWMRWSREVRAEACDDPDIAALVADARTTFEAANVALATSIRVASADDWKAAAWLLEHRRGDPKARHDDRRARWEAEIAAKRAKGEHVDRVAVDDGAVAELREKLKRALGE